MTPGQSESARVVEKTCVDLHYLKGLDMGDIQFLNNIAAPHTRYGSED